MGWIEHDHDNSDALIAQVAGLFDALCNDAIDARGRAWLALAGGRTPLPIYARLAASAQAGRILAIPTDERCVPHDHPASGVILVVCLAVPRIEPPDDQEGTQ